jgi:glycosyltransferase involved in cell wall biosynthesis
MVDALAAQHEVATITECHWNVEETNAFYGTSIRGDRVIQHVVPASWRWLSAFREGQLTRLRMCAVLRRAAALASQFDVMISADDFAPFPKRGIQYVHFPAYLQPEPARMKAIVHWYFRLCDRVLGAPWSDARRNLTLTNSRWSADGLMRLGEIAAPRVLYPPVLDPGRGVPWQERDDTFLCVGRFHGSKRLEVAIAIVKAVRSASLPNARLIIVGSPVDAEYTSRIRRLAAADRDWIDVREDLSRAELNALMGRSRYGIQAMEREHFGMATAEMTRAGCLVFAHDSGGSREVLNHEDALLWSTDAEAVRKIGAIVAADSSALRERLQSHARAFSTEAFVDGVRLALRELAEQRIAQ